LELTAVALGLVDAGLAAVVEVQVLGANLKGGEAEFRSKQRSLCKLMRRASSQLDDTAAAAV
jgi:hypothetical protein